MGKIGSSVTVTLSSWPGWDPILNLSIIQSGIQICPRLAVNSTTPHLMWKPSLATSKAIKGGMSLPELTRMEAKNWDGKQTLPLWCHWGWFGMASIIRTTWNDFLIVLFPAIFFFLVKITDPLQFDEKKFYFFLLYYVCIPMSNCMISITMSLLALHLPCVLTREYSQSSHLANHLLLIIDYPTRERKSNVLLISAFKILSLLQRCKQTLPPLS